MYWRIQALLAKIETTYGDDATPTGATNGILASDVKVMPMEGTDVQREHELPYMGARGTIATGLHAKISFKVEVKGSGVAGTPPAIGVLLRACAMAETVVAVTSVTYNPITDGQESVTLYFNNDGTNYKFLGTRGTFVYRLTAEGIVQFEFEFTGLYSKPTAMAMPTVTLGSQLTQIPQVATSDNTPTFTIGGRSLALRQFAMSQGHTVRPRFLVRDRSIKITDKAETIDATIEAVSLATYNPFVLAEASTPEAISLVHGTGAGKICSLEIPSAQIQRPSGLENQDGIVEWPLKYVPLPVTGNDQYTLAFT